MRAAARRAVATLSLALASACGSQVVSLGGPDWIPAAPDLVGAPIAACSGGLFHPNLCCAQGLDGPSCLSLPSSPFAPCPAPMRLYPDPRSCCSIEETCVSVEDAGPPPLVEYCTYACPSGWVCDSPCPPAAPIDAGRPPPFDASEDVELPPPPPPDAAVSIDGGFFDAGLFDAGFSEAGDSASSSDAAATTSPVESCPAACPACPFGWESTVEQPEVCCTVNGAGTECFSLADGPAPGP